MQQLLEWGNTMLFSIKNSSHQLLVLTLNSGETIHLAPQEISESMDEVEIKDNPQLEKMKKHSLITIEEKNEDSLQQATEGEKEGGPESSAATKQASGNNTSRD